MAQPWLDAGYECWIFDSQHPIGEHREGNLVRVGLSIPDNIAQQSILLTELKNKWGTTVEFVFGFPPCTDLAVSGACHFEVKRFVDPLFHYKATELALFVGRLGEYLGVPWAFENPISVLSTRYRKPDFMFHPWEYGGYLPVDDVHPTYPDYIAPRDAYPKKTCIWSGGGFVVPSKSEVECPKGYSTQHKKLGGKSMKTKNIRSATPRGFAMAVFSANG